MRAITRGEWSLIYNYSGSPFVLTEISLPRVEELSEVDAVCEVAKCEVGEFGEVGEIYEVGEVNGE
jgi:hypothetical protein